MTTVLRAPAKLTLPLRIIGLRDDGFHLIDAEMVTLDLHDEVTIDPDAVGVTVSFSPDDPKKGMAAVGTTDSQGRFKLTTRVAGDGAVPGEYTVTITKSAAKATGTATVATMSDPRGSATGVLSPEQQKEVLEKMKAAQNQKADTSASDIPAKYASRDTSDLKASVTAGGQNEFTFPMTK